MKIHEIIVEGGWTSTVTQGTKITPAIIKPALGVLARFIDDFNAFLETKNLPPVRMGKPTGSTAHHEADLADPQRRDTIYGDIDMQMIAPELEGVAGGSAFASYWNRLAGEFVEQRKPASVHSIPDPGHPVFEIAPGKFVQIDFMWHPEPLAKWGASRATPERGLKGLLHGNMFSTLGELLDMSIQHAGVQLKVIDGQQVPFNKRKGTELVTVTTDPENFIMDLFRYEYKTITGRDADQRTPIDPLLKQYPGNDINDTRIAKLVNSVKGLARSLEANNLFGKGNLAQFGSASDFINQFVQHYEQKAMNDVNGTKRDKAQHPDDIARADMDKKKIVGGLATVKDMFR
jgi:hypothetical protein